MCFSAHSFLFSRGSPNWGPWGPSCLVFIYLCPVAFNHPLPLQSAACWSEHGPPNSLDDGPLLCSLADMAGATSFIV